MPVDAKSSFVADEPRSLFSNVLIGGCRIEEVWGRTGVMRGNRSERRLMEEQPEWSK